MRRTIEISLVSLLLAGCAGGRDLGGDGFRGETEGHESSSGSDADDVGVGDVGCPDGDCDACDDDDCDADCEDECKDECEDECKDECDDEDCEKDCKAECEQQCDDACGDDDCDDDGCVRTQGYWKNHLEHWSLDAETDLCGTTLYDWLWIEPSGDAWIILVHQWIAASLNAAAGVSAPDDVQTALVDAETMLGACAISDEDREAAIDLATMLDEFNMGNAGVAKCD